MKLYKLLLLSVFAVLMGMETSYAAFPVKTSPSKQEVVSSDAASGSVRPAFAKKQNFITKARKLVHLPMPKARPHEDSSLFSVLSFVFSLVGWVMFPLALVFALIGTSAAVVIFLLGVLFAIAAMVLGITALVRQQKLKGLAIAGIIISGFALIEVLGLIAAIIALI